MARKNNKADDRLNPWQAFGTLTMENLAILASYSQALRERKPMTSEVFARHLNANFGRLSDEEVPVAGTISRQLAKIEKKLGPLIVRANHGATGFCNDGEAICAAAEAALEGWKSAMPHPEEAAVTLAVGETALHYLFGTRPVMQWLRTVCDRGVAVRTLPYDRQTTAAGLLKREIDLGCAWHAGPSPALLSLSNNSPELDVHPLSDRSEQIRPALIYHPEHPLANLLEEGKAFKSGLVARHTLFVSKAAGVREYAEAVTNQFTIVGLPHLSSVVTHVCLRTGVGLVPVWDFVLKQLGRDYHLRHTFLPETPIAEQIRFGFSIFRVRHRQLSAAAKSFLVALEEALAFQERASEWDAAPDHVGIDDTMPICNIQWHARHLYLPEGSPHRVRCASWTIRFAPASGDTSNLKGLIEGGGPLFDTMEVHGRLLDGRLVLSAFSHPQGMGKKPWSACLTKTVRRIGYDDQLCLIGILSTAEPDNAPTASLFILANYDIRFEDVRLIARDVPASFLADYLDPVGGEQ